VNDVENAIEPGGGFFRGGIIYWILPVNVRPDGHAVVFGSLKFTDQPCVSGFIIRQREDGCLEAERSELLLGGGSDLRMFSKMRGCSGLWNVTNVEAE
jgi:hypothetical protein